MNTMQAVLQEVKKAVSGKDEVLLWILTAILAKGHILLEDIPGVGKTTIALAFARALGLKYGRVQFTPDVLPSDITGYSIYQKETGRMQYQPGAVLCNLFLADELNRATSRTQSALLEAMEEGQVTVDGITHHLPEPFFVVATQNPVGAAGTQLLPDSQMDRFSIRLSIGYPDADAEFEMVQNRANGNPIDSIRQIVTLDELVAVQGRVAAIYLDDALLHYIIALVGATRGSDMILRGASPRATLSIAALARAVAYMQGRDYVVPNDIELVLPRAVEHRLLLRPEAEQRGVSAPALLRRITKTIPAPRI